MRHELIIKDSHRGLWYEDGKLLRILEAGRYKLPRRSAWPVFRRPQVDVVLVDIRERELTIKGQEILTSDKVAIRVSILVQFRVFDPKAAIHVVANYEERLYSDVQLAARRSLASMSLDEILTNRNRLSEDILRDVKESAQGYGVAIVRADVKDLVFPGNLQEIMNRVLAAERMSQVQLVEARSKAETQKLDAQAKAEAIRRICQASGVAAAGRTPRDQGAFPTGERAYLHWLCQACGGEAGFGMNDSSPARLLAGGVLPSLGCLRARIHVFGHEEIGRNGP